MGSKVLNSATLGFMLKKLACSGVVGMALVAACSGSSDDGDAGLDATSDQTIVDAPHEAAADVAQQDVTQQDVANDVTQQDVTQDAAVDAAEDTIEDAPAEVSKSDASDAAKETSTDAGGCTSSSDCLSTEYCDKTFGDCGGTGTCTTIPSFCPTLCSYMCGCDDKTYCNSCYAAVNGRTTIAYTGACE